MEQLSFLISTDSGCDLPKQVLDEHNIYALSLQYSDPNNTYRDTMQDIDTINFYQNMRNGVVYKTSAVNAYEAYHYLEELLKVNPNIIHICLGSAISSTYHNFLDAVRMLKKDYPESNITVIDSTLASIGYGMLALEACEQRNKGRKMEDVVNFLEEVKHNIQPYFTVPTLTYLHRGGRVSKTSMILGNILSIRPVLRLNYAGELKVYNKCHGEKATIRKIIENIKAQVINAKEQTLYVAHGDNLEFAKKLAEVAKDEIGFKDIHYSFIGSTIGAHSGPGTVTLFFHGKDRLA